MRRTVDAEREPAGDGETVTGQLCREPGRGVAADGRGIAAADDRELRERQHLKIALDEQC